MHSSSFAKHLPGLAAWLFLCLATGAVGAIASASAGQFYAQLIRPAWAPPGWLFAPVWSALYVLMGVAAWLVWRSHGLRGARVPLVLFVVQLALNGLWTWLFFVWRQGGLAFVEIILLWLLIVVVTMGFWRLKPMAGVLLLPYLAWVTFASALTLSVWRLNPELL